MGRIPVKLLSFKFCINGDAYKLGLSHYKRDQISNWAIIALEKSGRDKEIIPLCKKVSEKIKIWEDIRTCILIYLETGKVPWEQKEWPLPQPDFEFSKSRFRRDFPVLNELISIAIYEKNPENVLFWYDKISEKRWHFGINHDEVAGAINAYAPERSVEIWKEMAENLINQVKPKAYQEAVKYLRKAQKIMSDINKKLEWDNYIKELRKTHVRKTRLMEILDQTDKNPIIKTSAN